MTTDELIQLIRTCSIAQVRKELIKIQKKDPRDKPYPQDYLTLVDFYQNAAKQKP